MSCVFHTLVCQFLLPCCDLCMQFSCLLPGLWIGLPAIPSLLCLSLYSILFTATPRLSHYSFAGSSGHFWCAVVPCSRPLQFRSFHFMQPSLSPQCFSAFLRILSSWYSFTIKSFTAFMTFSCSLDLLRFHFASPPCLHIAE